MIMLTLVTLPYYLTITQSKNCAEVDHILYHTLLHVVFKNAFLKPIGKFGCFEMLHWTHAYCCSVIQSCLTPWLHWLQQTRLTCTSPSPRICWDSCPLHWWGHSIILSSAIPFSSCLQSFPASGSFLMSQLFASHGRVWELQHQSFQWIFRTDFH